MAALLFIFAFILIFIVAVISPHAAGKIQWRANEKASRLKRMSNWLWNPLTWWAKKSIEVNRKMLNKFAKWGKKTRRKTDNIK